MAKQQLNLSYTGREIVWRIKYSLINSVNLFSQEDSVELIPIIDRILLLFQKNVGIELIKNDKKQVSVFSFSGRLGKTTIKEQWNKNKDSYLVGTFDFDSNYYNLYVYKIDANDEIIKPLDGLDKGNVVGLIELLNGNHSKLSGFLRTRLNKAFSGNSIKTKENHQFGSSDFKLTKEILESEISSLCKDSIREVLDDAFGSFSHNPLIYNRKFKMATFFTVIRYPFLRGSLNYSAQILLSGQQFKVIKNDLRLANNQFPEGFSIQSFEDPLDGTSTSLADRCFSLDTVQFGLPYDSKNQNEVTPTDSTRRSLEDEFYKKLLDNKPPANVFYVPIHVNGSAWIAIYRILPNENQFDNWFLNFEMYNQYTLLVAEKVRLKAKEKYFKLLFSLINRAAFKSNETEQFIVECEYYMNILSAFYPFPTPFFSRSGIAIGLDEYLIRMVENKFSLKVNSLWNSTVEHDKLEIEELTTQIIYYCRQVGESIKNKKIEEDIRDASYSISHLLKNKLDEPYNEVKGIIENLNYLNEFKGLGLDSSEYLNRFNKFKTYSEDLRDTLQILDLIPKSSISNEGDQMYSVFLKKDSFLEVGSLNLLSLINEVAERKGVKIEPSISTCIIEPFIRNNDGINSSPAKFIYHNCLVEVMINYLNISKEGSLIVKKCIDANGTVGVCFKNETNIEEECHEDFREVSRKYGFHGAIGYLKTVFNKIGIGNIKKRVQEEKGKNYFEIGLFLNGIKITDNEQ